jgi:uncharacterized protein (TIGR02284 family)
MEASMEAPDNSAVKLLNGLIETTLASADGYEEAAGTAGEGQLKTMFAERSRHRRDLARRLQQEVRTFGAEPRDCPSPLGRARNAFLELKAAVLGGRGERAVIGEVERGEDLVRLRFEQALRVEDLPPNARQAVSYAYEAIRADHDEVARLKDELP